MKHSHLSHQQWSVLLALLSMDCVLPLYESMDLKLEDPQLFGVCLKEAILSNRRLVALYPAKEFFVIDLFAERLDHIGASRDGASFERWSHGIFLGSHAKQPDWSCWDIVFSQWAHGHQKDIDYYPEWLKHLLVNGYREKVSTGDTKLMIQSFKYEKLSDWDIEMFARHGYGVDEYSDPFMTVEGIVRLNRLKNFIKSLDHKVSPEDRERIEKDAQALINEMGVWMPGPIPTLIELRKK